MKNYKKIIQELSSFSDYVQFLELSRLLSFDILDDIFVKIDSIFDNKDNYISDKIAYLRFLLEIGKKDIFEKNFSKFNIDNFSNLYNFSDKKEAILFFLEHSKNFENKKTNLSISSIGLVGSGVLSEKNNFYSWNIPKNKILGDIKLSANNPIFYIFSQNNFLNAPSLFSSKNSNSLKINKKIFFVNENAGQDGNGEYFVEEKLENGDFLQVGKLYKVQIDIDILDFSSNYNKNLEMRHILPSSSDIFLKEKNYPKIVKKIGNTIFVDFGEPSKEKLKFSYYFRPKNSGNYIFPATFGYFVEDRQNYANDSHFYLHFQ